MFIEPFAAATRSTRGLQMWDGDTVEPPHERVTRQTGPKARPRAEGPGLRKKFELLLIETYQKSLLNPASGQAPSALRRAPVGAPAGAFLQCSGHPVLSAQLLLLFHRG